MKKYDRIYISDDEEELFQEVFGPVIVLTIEELGEMWSAAERRDRWFFEREEFEKQKLPEPPDFAQYLTSKGIELP